MVHLTLVEESQGLILQWQLEKKHRDITSLSNPLRAEQLDSNISEETFVLLIECSDTTCTNPQPYMNVLTLGPTKTGSWDTLVRR